MLKVVGAGLPRTATWSQSEALPVLLGGQCYHMHQVMQHHDHVDTWIDALNGKSPDWNTFLEGYTAAVDWPASIFWEELAEANPDALILLSTRDSAETWYRSMSNTVLKALDMSRQFDPADLPEGAEGPPPRFIEMTDALWQRFVGEDSHVTPQDAEGAQRMYEKYVQHVRDTAPADRLLEWNASEGWGPLCERLGLPVPDQPFPHSNTTADFQKMMQDGGPDSTSREEYQRRMREKNK